MSHYATFFTHSAATRLRVVAAPEVTALGCVGEAATRFTAPGGAT